MTAGFVETMCPASGLAATIRSTGLWALAWLCSGAWSLRELRDWALLARVLCGTDLVREGGLP